MQTKKQKREKALAYWENELRKDCLPRSALYIKGQIAILRRKLTLRTPDAGGFCDKLGFIYAVSFFWLDGFAVPVPAQVKQTVRPHLAQRKEFTK